MSYLSRSLPAALVLAFALSGAPRAAAQCTPMNPSFEIAGSSGAVFAGWNQFGTCGSSTSAVHGSVAAKLSGPNSGTWAVSGYWQQFECAVGEQWAGSVVVMHPSSRPLTGQCTAIVNVEWRDSAGNLISYESHTAADASTPTDVGRVFTFQSNPAPSGTVATRIVLGVLQSPTDPVPDVIFDQVTFHSLASPTAEESQWTDFPSGRTVSFAGRSWRVKGPGYYGPGPGNFGASADYVWVDTDGRLHMTIKKTGSTWYSTEVTLEEALGYGDYVFTTRGRLDTLDPRAVLGLFTWEYGQCYDASYLWWNPYNEVDVEISRWGVAGNALAQFVAQPYDWTGNLERFDATYSDGEVTSYAFRWLPDKVEFRSWRGGPTDEATSTPIHTWTYTKWHIPRPEQPRVHINFWRFDGTPATNQEVVLDAFTFVPACVTEPCGTLAVDPPVGTPSALLAPRPNPFRSSTAIRYVAARGGRVQIAVFDLLGRRQRTLFDGQVPAGEREVVWDGRDDAGGQVPAGVYLCRVRTDDIVQTRRMILVR
jgi:hypothetical protein